MSWFDVFFMLFLFRALGLCSVVLYKSFTSCEEKQVYFDGFQIKVGVKVKGLLTAEEFAAVLQHETGHRYYLHFWKNLIRALFFLPHTKTRRLFQEKQADSCVTDKLAFASALEKLGAVSEIDCQRLTDLKAHYEHC